MERERGIAAMAGLDEPTRRRLYDHVAARAEPVSRDAAARALGIGRSVAAFHLDKLADLGLLEVSFRRPPGRSGPGAGRPTKLYRRSREELAVSLPERRYALAASLMAEGIEAAEEGSVDVGQGLDAAARRRGHSLGEGVVGGQGPLVERVEAVLTDGGYEPRRTGPVIELANCPFHSLTERHRTLVCRLNLELLAGLCEEAGIGEDAARLDPSPGRCCVRLVVGES